MPSLSLNLSQLPHCLTLLFVSGILVNGHAMGHGIARLHPTISPSEKGTPELLFAPLANWIHVTQPEVAQLTFRPSFQVRCAASIRSQFTKLLALAP
ncbi:hypothetical protein V8F06_011287 [Rhypophila decipiens]